MQDQNIQDQDKQKNKSLNDKISILKNDLDKVQGNNDNLKNILTKLNQKTNLLVNQNQQLLQEKEAKENKLNFLALN